MAGWDRGLLDAAQSGFVARELGDPILIEDLSWGLVDTRVLHVRSSDREVVVKAAGVGNHHIGREITAHANYTEPLVQRSRTARLVAADRDANALIVEYQPGTLVEGSDHEFDASAHEQAGAMLRALHDQTERVDDDYEARATTKAIAWLDRGHRIDPDAASSARRILESYRPRRGVLVPTHGDWQPRNWLVESGFISAIDFGRFDFRPAYSDFSRLATQQWKGRHELEAAFLRGYGSDPRDANVWPIELLREAVSTSVWAFHVGDDDFEAHGHETLSDALDRF